MSLSKETLKEILSCAINIWLQSKIWYKYYLNTLFLEGRLFANCMFDLCLFIVAH